LRLEKFIEANMKIRITVGANEQLSGYVNIDPISKFNDLAIDIRDLSEVVENSECREILAEDVIDFLEKKESFTVISNWISKLRHGGKIIITSVDAHVTSGLLYKGKIELSTFNKLMHGNFTAPWDVKLSHSTIEEMSSFLISQGLVINKKRQNGPHMIIEAERP